MWRFLARVVGVLALGAGVGILTWGITSAAMGEELRTPWFVPNLDILSAEAIGWGAGLLAGGLTALALALGPAREELPLK